MILSILQDKSNFLALHNFTRGFSGTTINQIVNKCWNGKLFCLFNLLFQLCKKLYLQNFFLIKKWLMMEIVDKHVFEITTNKLVLACRFRDHNLVLSFVYTFMKYVCSAKIRFLKTSTIIMKQVIKLNPGNMHHENINIQNHNKNNKN